MQHIVVVFHSGYGNTEKQAEAVVRGARTPRTSARLLSVEGALGESDALVGADGIVFGAPTYMGSVSAPFKAFMDATARDLWPTQALRDKVAAGFTCSAWPSGDKLQSLVQLSLFAMQHGMIWVGQDGLPRDGDDAPNRLGSWLGAMGRAAHGTDGPTAGDLRSAEALGLRVADVVLRMRAQG